MKLSNQNSIKKSVIQNKILNYFSLGAILLTILAFLFLIIFIIKESVAGFQHYGFVNIFVSNQFNFEAGENGVSFWFPLSITLFISFFALIIAAPIGVKTAFFLYFRLSKRWRSFFGLLVEILAGIPSVIFGVFARNYLGEFLKTIFNLTTSFNLITAFFMLAFMVLPTIISIVLQALRSSNADLMANSMALGVNKNHGIYKIVYKKIRPSIIVAVLIAFGRALGETMAVSMILQSEDYTNVFNSGANAFVSSSLVPLGALISVNMFSDGAGPVARSLLFGFGVALLVIVTLLNFLILFLTKRFNEKKEKPGFLSRHFGSYFLVFKTQWENIKNTFVWTFEKIIYPSAAKIGKEKVDLAQYTIRRKKSHKLYHIPTIWRVGTEWFAAGLVMLFLLSILIVIIHWGLIAFDSPQSTLFSYTKNTTGAAFVNTLLIITVSIFISLPISLLAALYLNEYCRFKRFKKISLLVLDILGSTPSILYGLFGLAFFILTLGWTSSGQSGQSLIAGALTVSIVIMPNFIRMIQVHLTNVTQEMRDNSYALGVSKAKTIWKIILPATIKGIISSTILTVGRIMGETAPLYLTAGLSSSRYIGLNQPGQTLTTRIYAQIFNNNLAEAQMIMYENALLSIIFIALIILLGNLVLPYIFANSKYTFQFLVYYYWNRLKVFKINFLLKWYLKLEVFKVNFSKDKLVNYSQKISRLEDERTQILLSWTK